MLRVARLALAGALVALPVGCSLVVSTSGLSGDGDVDAAGAPTSDAPSGNPDAAALPETAVPEASLDGGAEASVYTDDFQREDATQIGNGWLAKTPAAFKLAGGAVVRQAGTSVNFTDNIVYRPTAEDATDVEVSIEFQLTSTASQFFPQVHARVQQSSVFQTENLDDYYLAINGTVNGARIARLHGGPSASVQLVFITLAPSLVTSQVYRLVLRVTGTTTVKLRGRVEMKGAGDVWTILGQAEVDDNDAARITTGGTTGFSAGYLEGANAYSYDNFTRTKL